MLDVVAILLVAVVFAVFWRIAHQRKRGIDAGGPLAIAADERRVAEIVVETRDICFGGQRLLRTGHFGKLILTNQRLYYTDIKEKSLALALAPAAMISALRGRDGNTTRLVLTYRNRQGTATRVHFAQAPGVQVSLFEFHDASQQMPIAMFLDRLEGWMELTASSGSDRA
jgi:hypothetical protein